MAMYNTQIAVIGAGTIGVSTAFNIIDTIPNVQVTLLSDQFSPNTTSDVAAGLWRPHRVEDTPQQSLIRWGQDTWDHLIKLVMSDLSKETGTFLTSGRELFLGLEDDPFWKDTVLGYRSLTDAELKLYPDRYKSGYFYTTIIADQTKYIPWLTGMFKVKGGKVKQVKVKDFGELTGYDIVVNCTGMGSRDLCDDKMLQPIRGHVIKANAPWVKHFVVAPEEKIHILCAYDKIVMGMTARNDTDPMFKEADRDHILSGCAELEPSVVKATDLRDFLGFRPVRPVVRMEVEHRQIGNTVVPIVHNYGHGGSGITLHWGCAKEATKLVKDIIFNSKNSSKL
jgi:glycine/D-amino acid oxidase-like deaminating enzyme